MPDPKQPEATKCKSCKADIIFGISPNGRRVPLDARPTTVYRLEGEDAVPVQHVHINHFVTCPTRNQHRKRHS